MRASELIGMRFGRLTVIARAENSEQGKTRWICQCDCGKVKRKPVTGYDLKSGKIRSCGCLYLDSNKERNKTHGMTNTRLWHIWSGMRKRCKSHQNYKNISVCDEWNNFEAFMEWANATGYRNDLTIDRIDNSGNYEPSNCRWATYKVQENNRSNNRHIIIDGIDRTLAEWSDISGISSDTLRSRLKYGWPMSDLFMPVNLANASIRKRMREEQHA